MAMNVFSGIGRATDDAKVTRTQDGKIIARFTYAIDRDYKSDNQPSADFIPCVAFGKTAEFCEKYVTKGSQFGFTGRIQTGSYTNKEGQKVYTTDCIVDKLTFCGSKAADKKTDADGFMNIDVECEELPFD